MFFDSFLEICKNFGIAPSRVLLEIGMGRSTVNNWRNGGKPSFTTMKKIADYFGISVQELETGIINEPKNAKKPDTLNRRDELRKINLELFDSMTDRQQDAALEYLRFLLSKDKD